MLKPDHLPFNALQAFEVAARAGSFVNAGRELGVSAAAVSQQVKLLEGRLGRQLFLRQGNRIMLTDAGRTLYPSVENALSELRTATRALQAAPRRARLLVSVLPSLAELWLIPNLRDFAGRAQLDIRIEDDPVDLARDGVDVRLTYGAQYYPDHVVEPLFVDRLVAVAAFDWRPEATLPALPDELLIQTDWGRDYGVQPDWAQHFAGQGVRRVPDQSVGLRVGTTALAAAAARAGLGVALIPDHLAADDLATGRLRCIGGVGEALPRGYVAISTNAQARNRGVAALRRHLMAAGAAMPGRA
ncbi:LysR substrate-binding domain-containing protein [Pararhodobacter sp.]|uniref:LysR substrate-binding domain-containing protein n=1 Tax=Pararhodobacter sp. TaxID=2127056 RepID=UPI002AFE3224|nr:LysR substrate-binding domain-containing protein [Pararhodobacter sp.]